MWRRRAVCAGLLWGLAVGVSANPLERQSLAEAWAPVFFHDESPEFNQVDTGFNPIDTPVSFFFDGNDDLRDNGLNAFRLSVEREKSVLENIPIYYSVIESRSHYYINYVVYHAMDGKDMGHVHDTENVLIIVEKDASRFGRFVMMITNAHGYPMIYGADQSKWRAKLADDAGLKILPALDMYSDEHHQGNLEWIGDRSPAVFVAREGHGLYKFSAAAWASQQIRGSVYFPKSCGECETKNWPGLRARRSYLLEDLDALIETKLTAKVDSSQFFAKRGLMRGHRNLYRDREIPFLLVQGYFEPEARVNLFYGAKFKTPFSLSDPSSVHRFFDDSSKISPIYIFNPYVERILIAQVEEKVPQKKVFSIQKASLLFFVDRLFE